MHLPSPTHTAEAYPGKVRTTIKSAEALMAAYHDSLQSLASLLKIAPSCPDSWEFKILDAFKNDSTLTSKDPLIPMALEMAALSPTLLPGWHQDAVPPSVFSAVWLASNRTLGAHWIPKASFSPVISICSDDPQESDEVQTEGKKPRLSTTPTNIRR